MSDKNKSIPLGQNGSTSPSTGKIATPVFPDSEFQSGSSTFSEVNEKRETTAEEQPQELKPTRELKFGMGNSVCSIYFAGHITSLPAEDDEAKRYGVTVKDQDKRIDGKEIYIFEGELREGITPRFIQEREASAKKNVNDKKRKPTYGELAVNLNMDVTGTVDIITDVFNIKHLFSVIIDEAYYQKMVREREILISSQEPNDSLGAKTGVVDMYKEVIPLLIELKFRMVSAALGNNDRANM